MMLAGKVCVVTGGGSGIGETVARRFAAEGASVMIADIDEKEGKRAAEEIARVHGPASAYALHADVSSEQDVCALVAEIVQRAGRIDVLFNNAAAILPKPLEEVAEQEWSRLVDINLKSVYLMTKHTVSLLRQTRGTIVNMASLSGLIGQKNNAAYAATKGGIVAMTKALALDYAADGVRVNCICPAGVMTPLLEKWIAEQNDPEAARASLDGITRWEDRRSRKKSPMPCCIWPENNPDLLRELPCP